ncbi:TMEM175 family protein [Dellaglioa carnosa]|uniref:TMEM175 family protein n=1 Tax=Dellaglioa carnosa TaxID=2995136 RepID=A0ABT4JM59_9LACO|nr:TMEM175 family protein [Dellaglioa carnosa]MCZ2491360.1 TMEM175 family protein [Dellaglioa carnosa]MCZ2494438.1 TMEM175 family protein [Dellaglioa carnosa]MDK1731146.1 TMEM175 family protein [Dellaglioa carnosa]
MKLDRVQAFSDGVFSILITIMVLEFHIDDFKPGHLFNEVLNQWPIFGTYLISYLYVGTLWLFHHDYIAGLKITDRGLNILNLLMLFSITLINYPMTLISAVLASGNTPDIRTAFIFYDLVALFISGTFLLIYFYVNQHSYLKSKAKPESYYQSIRFDPLGSMAIYGTSIALSFVNIWLSGFLLVAGIIYHFIAYIRMSASEDLAEKLALNKKNLTGK